MTNNWISVGDQLPPFDKDVLVYCRIYGLGIYRYVQIGGENSVWGNWHDGERLGVLPPIYWMPIPELPDTKTP